MILTTIMANAWAIQTHRAINRTAYQKADNLSTLSSFHQSSGVTHRTI